MVTLFIFPPIFILLLKIRLGYHSTTRRRRRRKNWLLLISCIPTENDHLPILEQLESWLQQQPLFLSFSLVSISWKIKPTSMCRVSSFMLRLHDATDSCWGADVSWLFVFSYSSLLSVYIGLSTLLYIVWYLVRRQSVDNNRKNKTIRLKLLLLLKRKEEETSVVYQLQTEF